MFLRARRSLIAHGAEKLGEDASDIATCLQQIGLGEHTETLRTEKIDAAVLPTLTDAERAIRARLDIVTAMPSVRAIHGPELACRIGISSGVVVVGESISVGAAAELTVLGEAPNLAARLQTAAPRNGVIIAAGTRALV